MSSFEQEARLDKKGNDIPADAASPMVLRAFRRFTVGKNLGKITFEIRFVKSATQKLQDSVQATARPVASGYRLQLGFRT